MAQEEAAPAVESVDVSDSPAVKVTVKTKKVACGACVNKNGVSTGLRDASTLCPECEGSGSVKK